MTQLYYSYDIIAQKDMTPLPYTPSSGELLVAIRTMIPDTFKYSSGKSYVGFASWLQSKFALDSFIIVRDSADLDEARDFYMVWRFSTLEGCMIAKLTHYSFDDVFQEYIEE